MYTYITLALFLHGNMQVLPKAVIPKLRRHQTRLGTGLGKHRRFSDSVGLVEPGNLHFSGLQPLSLQEQGASSFRTSNDYS
jgi:hypothetical protein